MCVYSMIVDHYADEWKDYLQPYTMSLTTPSPSPITAAEIEEFRKLLERAREYDKKNSEPDCETESKKELLRQLAEKLGVKIDFL